MLTAANMTTRKAQEVLVADSGRLLVENEDAYPAYEQFESHDLGSEEVAASATEFLPTYAIIPTLAERVLLVTITPTGAEDPVVSIGIDIAARLDSGGAPVWYRRITALATGLTGASGLTGKVVLDLPAGLWARYLRVWVTETGGDHTVTVAALVGGRP